MQTNLIKNSIVAIFTVVFKNFVELIFWSYQSWLKFYCKNDMTNVKLIFETAKKGQFKIYRKFLKLEEENAKDLLGYLVYLLPHFYKTRTTFWYS